MGKAIRDGRPHPPFIAGQITEYRYFFLNLTPAPESELTVACGGWERCASDYRIERADFEFYGIEYVAHGRGRLTVGGADHELLPGSVFAYQPFTAHTIRTNPDDPLVKYFINFSGRGAQRIIGRKILGAQGVAYLHRAQPVHELYEQTIETGHKGAAWRREYAAFCSNCCPCEYRKTRGRPRRLMAGPGRVLSDAGKSYKSIFEPFIRSPSWPV